MNYYCVKFYATLYWNCWNFKLYNFTSSNLYHIYYKSILKFQIFHIILVNLMLAIFIILVPSITILNFIKICLSQARSKLGLLHVDYINGPDSFSKGELSSSIGYWHTYQMPREKNTWVTCHFIMTPSKK